MKHTKRVASLLLITAMTLSILAGCGAGGQGGKALHIDNGTSYSVDFTIERVCIPGN